MTCIGFNIDKINNVLKKLKTTNDDICNFNKYLLIINKYLKYGENLILKGPKFSIKMIKSNLSMEK